MTARNMTNLGAANPISPWVLVTRRLLDGFDVDLFALKHGLDAGALAEEFESGLIKDQATIAALAVDTNMSEDFFRNLTARYEAEDAKQSDHLRLKPGTFADQ